jgi:hypothetical protein
LGPAATTDDPNIPLSWPSSDRIDGRAAVTPVAFDLDRSASLLRYADEELAPRDG